MLDNFLYGTHVSQKSHASRKSRRFLGGGVALTAAALSLQVLSPSLLPRAEAGASWLCSGFSSCSSKGMSDHGYRSHWQNMYWRMYPYRNCVNYVAYKVIQDGGPESRPWSGSGNATNWGYAMSDITDRTPRPGAVAWWRAHTAGAGSYGHVAYVEKVISSSEIIISESNYGSDFSWRRITKSGSGWPTGFIHFPDRRIDNVVRPRLEGTPIVGGTLRIVGGKWDPVSRPSHTWYADGEELTWADGRSLKLGSKLAGKRITAVVTASKSGYTSASRSTVASAPVASERIRNLVAPRIVGTTKVGERLKIQGGKWNPVSAPSVTWYADGREIDGANKRSLYLVHWLAGSRITAKVTATKAGYASGSVTTAPTGTVRGNTLRSLVRPHLAGKLRPGTRIAITGGKWSPVATPSYTWYVNGKRVPGLKSRSFVLGKRSAGKKVSARVTATKSGYNTASVTTPTITVR